MITVNRAHLRINIVTALIFLFPQTPAMVHATTQNKPAIQHATIYKGVDDISHYWLSEKLDGVRGYWNGKQLITRQGNIIQSPSWFTKNWPNHAIDGELWLGRDLFQATVSCLRKKIIDDTCWQKMRFMIFDLPKDSGKFSMRIAAMKTLVTKVNSPYLAMIKQFKLKSLQQLENRLTKITENQGEGLMLHHENAYYHVGRTSNIMKLKKHQDAEARVIAHLAGKGKYQGMLGAIKVKTAEGIVFKIGSGFSDAERAQPPAIGSIITYKFNGKTKAGVPRFARYFRIRKHE